MAHLDVEHGRGAKNNNNKHDNASSFDEKRTPDYSDSPIETEQPQTRSSRILKIFFHILIVTCLLTWIGGCLSTGLKRHHDFLSSEMEEFVEDMNDITASFSDNIGIEAEVESKLSRALQKRQDNGNAATPPSPNTDLESTTSLDISSVTSDTMDTSSQST